MLPNLPKTHNRLRKYSNFYTPASKKFDGYFQCPRPRTEYYFNEKNARMKPVFLTNSEGQGTKLASSRLPDDIRAIPRPVTHLTFPSSQDQTVTIYYKEKRAQEEKRRQETLELERIQKFTQTAQLVNQHLQAEKKFLESFQGETKKEERIPTRGRFQVKVPNNGVLYRADHELMKATNPIAFAQEQHYWNLDRKILEKRRQQRELKNRLINS